MMCVTVDAWTCVLCICWSAMMYKKWIHLFLKIKHWPKKKNTPKNPVWDLFKHLIPRNLWIPVPGIPGPVSQPPQAGTSQPSVSFCSSFSTACTKAGKCWSRRQKRMKGPSSWVPHAGCQGAGGSSSFLFSTDWGSKNQRVVLIQDRKGVVTFM